MSNNVYVVKNNYVQLSKLTLIVPTRDRNYYLSRWLWYTAQFPIGKIIVADSSSNKKKEINQSTICTVLSKYPELDITYLDCQPETDFFGGDIFRKWADGVKHVTTAYCKMCTDKEFICPDGLSDCIAFLSEHPDYIASEGVHYAASPKYKFKSKENCPMGYIIAYPGRCSEDADDALLRYADAFDTSKLMNFSLLIAVINTKNMGNLYDLLYKYDIPDLRYSELILGWTGYLMGKVSFLPASHFSVIDYSLVSCPKYRVTRGTVQSSSTRYPYRHEYPSYGVDLDFYNRFKKCMISQLHEYGRLTDEGIERYVEDNISYSKLNSLNKLKLKCFKQLSSSEFIEMLMHTLICTFWRPLSLPTQRKICSYLYKYPLSLPLVDKPAEAYFSKIGNYITSTIHMYDTDQPLTEQDFLRTYK